MISDSTLSFFFMLSSAVLTH